MNFKISGARASGFAVAAGLSAFAIPQQARAEEAPEQFEAGDNASGEILVTARKREESLQDVPVAITAVSGETLSRQQINRVSDFSAKLPNFTAVQQNTRVSGLYVRGLGGNANNDGAESGVGLIVKDGGGKVIEQGTMDKTSKYTFKKPEGAYMVVFDAGEGHKIEIDGKKILE